MYQHYSICLLCSYIMVYVPAIYLWCWKLLSFGHMSYKFCVVIYLSTKVYFIVGWSGLPVTNTMHLHSVTLSKMLHLGS